MLKEGPAKSNEKKNAKQEDYKEIKREELNHKNIKERISSGKGKDMKTTTERKVKLEQINQFTVRNNILNGTVKI